MRPTGTLSRTASYDSETGLFGVFDPAEFPLIDTPTRQDAISAMTRLVRLLDGFDFKDRSDKAAALSAILTAAVRPSLQTAPGFLATAHTHGSGKSYLLDMIAAFATPDKPPSATFVTDDDEMRKQLLAKLIESPPVLKFDEMKGDLVPVKCLLSAITSDRIEGRILEVSKMARPCTRSLMLFAGNNVSALQDMTRRVVTISLDPQCESPATREFHDDPLEDQLRANRAAYLADALTVIRAWIVAGQPRANVRSLNGFSQWADWCRQPIIWLGLPDPCAPMFTCMDDDPERELLSRLLHVWKNCFGEQPQMVREIVRRASDVADLHDVLHEIAGFRDEIDRKRLGKWLKASMGKIVDGMRLGKDHTFKRNADYWRLTVFHSEPSGSDYSDLTDSQDRKSDHSDMRESRNSRLNRNPSAHHGKLSPRDGVVFDAPPAGGRP